MRTVFHWDSQRFLSNNSTEIRKRRGSTWIVFIKPFRQAPICSVNILVLDPMRSPLRHLSLSLFQNWAIFHLSTRSHEIFLFFNSVTYYFHRKELLLYLIGSQNSRQTGRKTLWQKTLDMGFVVDHLLYPLHFHFCTEADFLLFVNLVH